MDHCPREAGAAWRACSEDAIWPQNVQIFASAVFVVVVLSMSISVQQKCLFCFKCDLLVELLCWLYEVGEKKAGLMTGCICLHQGHSIFATFKRWSLWNRKTVQPFLFHSSEKPKNCGALSIPFQSAEPMLLVCLGSPLNKMFAAANWGLFQKFMYRLGTQKFVPGGSVSLWKSIIFVLCQNTMPESKASLPEGVPAG